VMATICGRCHQSFAPFEAQYPFEVQSFTTLLAEAIGVRHEDRFKELFRTVSVPGMLAKSSENAGANGLSREEVEEVLPDYVARFCPRGG